MSTAALPLNRMPAALPGTPQRMAYGDAVRVLGTIAVVIGHVCDMELFKVAPETRDWWILNIVDAACRWAVPVYIMLSGALLLDPARTETPSVFYRKRLARLGVPLVFWSAFFMLFGIYYLGPGWGYTWPSSLRNLALGQPYAHLHFIFRIAILYAFTPMFRIFVKHAPRSMQVAAVAILFGVWSADSLANGFVGTNLSAFARFAPFASYYLAGYLLRESYAQGKQLVLHAVNVVLCTALLAGISGLLCMKYGVRSYPSVPMILFDFLSPVRIPMALSAWILLISFFRHRTPEASRLARTFAFLAPTTLGLYLIHPMFRELLYAPFLWRDFCATHLHLNLLWQFNGLSPLRPNVFAGILLTSAVVYIVSLVSVLLLMRIPVVRRIVE